MFIRDSRRSYRAYSYAELILITDLYMFIRDSRRSYRAYSYAKLILITDLCSFETPVGIAELMIIQRYLYTYWYLYLFRSPVRVYRTYAYIEVPLGSAKLILIS